MEKKRSLFLVIFLLLVVALSQGCSSKNDKDYNVEQFIKEKQIINPKIVALKDKSYIFSGENTIYVFRNKGDFEYFVGEPNKSFVIGGLEKGSVGIIIKNIEIAKNIKSYKVILDSIGTDHELEYKEENNLVVLDERIWNPNPNFKIIFYNNLGEEILTVNH
ncbi:hypothetical protein [Cohnella sp. 56]|uniref:hypothetical protein n=1 Tax=Cohnella sp. 56 TaxID=3113722 RepID=UPI0030E9AFCD